jgi:malate dehydrogenase (oxaloacetate-decarboxylating)(NADP+)
MSDNHSSDESPEEKVKRQRAEAALEYHRGTATPAGFGEKRAGKIEVVASKSLLTQRDLSYAYSPGVAAPCREIAKNPDDAYVYTAKGNLVAVITNGTAVLGLGDIGPLAAKPVMEGKAVLFKKFADLDCFDIEVDAKDPQRFIDVVAALEPTFGGINLEDIKAPECFIIEKTLKEKMNIPVFHDDQHGTAIISGAALLNALEITGRRLDEVKVVFCGGGAASISCARFWLTLGVKLENVIMTDRIGVISKGRVEEMNEFKAEFSLNKTPHWHTKMPVTLADALLGADIFVGCSAGNVVTGEMLKAMAPNPIVFAMANPDPEIAYDVAKAARADMIFATGRSDYPNQVNNVLGYPFIFRGALDVRAKTINEEMKIAAARAIAELAKQQVPESVVQAYGGEPLAFGPDYIIPKPFDPRVLLWVSPAVAQAAIDSGVSRRDLPGGSVEAYRARLEKLLNRTRSVMRTIKDRMRTEGNQVAKANGGKARPIRLVFPEGANEKILRAAAIIREDRTAEPILLGDPKVIRPKIQSLKLWELDDCEIIRPSKSPDFESYTRMLWELRKRKGLTPDLASQLMKDPLYFGAMLVRQGKADAWLSGLSRSYSDTIRPALQVIGSRAGQKVAGIYMLVHKEAVYFIGDTTVNMDPTAEDLAEIAINTSSVAASLGFEPRVAMLSFSNFGSNNHPEAEKVRRATQIVQRRRPDLVIDGEMQADTAVSPRIMQERYPFCRLREQGANVLICPTLSAANIAYKLLGRIGGLELVGPILVGMNKPIHVLQLNAEVSEVVNMAVIAVMDAQRQLLHHDPIEQAWPSHHFRPLTDAGGTSF